MKILSALVPFVMFAFATQAQAEVLNFRCLAGHEKTINSFQAQGQIETQSSNSASGSMTIDLILAGSNRVTSSLGTDSVSGTVKVISAGHLSISQVTSLSLQAAGSSAHATVNLGLKGPTSSSLLVDGVLYKAECSQLN
jgi:hypothetical protein